MREDLLYFIWKFRFYNEFKINGFDNKQIEIINPGLQNFNSGPDFTGAQIRNHEATWVGNIEIDIKSSNWYKHGHHLNKEFNNVVLQVVTDNDAEVRCENGRIVPSMEIKIEPGIIQKYNDYLKSNTFVPCSADLNQIDQLKLNLWLGKTLVLRMEQKSAYISSLLTMVKNSWEETFYQLLARSFGFNVNADPFEWLAKSLPLKYLARHHGNLFQIEALLFGQAGFLEDISGNNDYYNGLHREYQFLKTKYQLIPIEKHMWKFMRTRPTNFPTIRISQFANLVFNSINLFSKTLEAKNVAELKKLFDVKASEFWNNHYQFEKESGYLVKTLGSESVDKILINTVIPLIFVYGQNKGDESIKDRAVTFLENIKPERNHIINKWKEAGMHVSSAFYSQALIHQKKEFCSNLKCLDCGIGVELMKNEFRKNNPS